MATATEVLIIGAGPGGYVGAIKLGKFGKKVLLVEKDKLGGECLNYGCIPSKALIHAAGHFYKTKKAADSSGHLSAQGLNLDWGKVQAWKNSLVSGFNRGIAGLTKGNKVDVVSGTAKFTGPHEAEIVSAAPGDNRTPGTVRPHPNDGRDGPFQKSREERGREEVHPFRTADRQKVAFEHALIVTGSRPVGLPGFDIDGKNVLSSKEALELPSAPNRLVVIGGGVIGLEIGTFYAKLGSRVTVIEFMPQVLPGLEPDLIMPVTRNLQKLGIELWVQSRAKSYTSAATGLTVVVDTPEGEKRIAADKILLSVGRAPVTYDLGLEAAGIELDAKGHIKVNEIFQTNIGHIYAAGDVIGPPYLAHKASREAIIAAQSIAGFTSEERGAIPWAVFTDPEISSVGETEAEARNRGAQILVGRFPFSASGRAQAVKEPEGFVKVIADKETHRVLGVGMVGPSASDLIGEACLAVKLGATVEDIASTIHPHPTLNEAFQEAAEACLGQAIHILMPGR